MGSGTREATMVDDITMYTEFSPRRAGPITKLARGDFMIKSGNVGFDVRRDAAPKSHQGQQYLLGKVGVKLGKRVDTTGEASVPNGAKSNTAAFGGGKQASISRIKAFFDNSFDGLLKNPKAHLRGSLDTPTMFGPVFLRVHDTPTEFKENEELKPAAPLGVIAGGLEREMGKECPALYEGGQSVSGAAEERATKGQHPCTLSISVVKLLGNAKRHKCPFSSSKESETFLFRFAFGIVGSKADQRMAMYMHEEFAQDLLAEGVHLE